MQMHAEPHKRRNGGYSLQGRLDFSEFLKTVIQTWYLWNCVAGTKKTTIQKN